MIVLLCPLASRATANRMLAAAVPKQRRERQIRDANPVGIVAERHDLAAGDASRSLAVEHHRRQHQDGRVDEERDASARPSNRSC